MGIVGEKKEIPGGLLECSWSYPVLRIGWIHTFANRTGYTTECSEVCWRRTKAPWRPSWNHYVLIAGTVLTGIGIVFFF